MGELCRFFTSIFLLFLSLVLSHPLAYGSNKKLTAAKEFFQNKEYKKAHDQLKSIPIEEVDPKRMAFIELFRGLIFFEQKNFSEAIEHLDKSLQLGTRLQDVAHYYRGLSYDKLSKTPEALKAFRKIKPKKTSLFLSQQASFEEARILFDSQKFNKALRIFTKIEKKMRSSELHPSILWFLLQIHQIKKKRLRACYQARKLYKNYPLYKPVSHWGLHWKNNLVHGKSLKCKDRLKDQQYRIRRLQQMGAGEKVLAELNELKKTKVEPFSKDMLMAEYLINEGMVDEAFSLLKPYYKDKKKRKRDFDFISLFAKAAARTGQYQATMGIYIKASKDFSGKKKRTALYRAAFLGYQNQDYDGALRLFQDLKKKHPYSALARQANWYIPWIYYLKGHYEESFNLFRKALRNRRGMLPRGFRKARLKYWMAMSKKRLGELEAAEKLFLEVSHDEYFGYYSIASVQRLHDLVGSRKLATLTRDHAMPLHENWLPLFSKESIEEKEMGFDQSLAKTNEIFHSEWDTLPYMREYLDMGKPSQIYSSVTEPEFRLHIERAEELGKMGMQKLAKWELYSIEKRTRNREYLKTLMYSYYRNQIYHRASLIGTRHFADDRKHLGLPNGKVLWRYVYPRAFEKEVLANGKRFDVPPEFVWSIMKAETNFRPDAMSPVGARGLMQVMTYTGKKVAALMGKKIQGPELLQAKVSIEIGTYYLKRTLRKFENKIPLAAAAYNGGPHRVHGWLHRFGKLTMDEFIEHIPYLETRNYVKKVTRYYTLYNLIYNDNPQASSWLVEKVNVYPEGTPPSRENWDVL